MALSGSHIIYMSHLILMRRKAHNKACFYMGINNTSKKQGKEVKDIKCSSILKLHFTSGHSSPLSCNSKNCTTIIFIVPSNHAYNLLFNDISLLKSVWAAADRRWTISDLDNGTALSLESWTKNRNISAIHKTYFKKQQQQMQTWITMKTTTVAIKY